MIISFMPCEVCNKLVLISKLTFEDGKYYCAECFDAQHMEYKQDKTSVEEQNCNCKVE